MRKTALLKKLIKYSLQMIPHFGWLKRGKWCPCEEAGSSKWRWHAKLRGLNCWTSYLSVLSEFSFFLCARWWAHLWGWTFVELFSLTCPTPLCLEPLKVLNLSLHAERPAQHTLTPKDLYTRRQCNKRSYWHALAWHKEFKYLLGMIVLEDVFHA